MIFEPSFITALIRDYRALEDKVTDLELADKDRAAQVWFYKSMRVLDDIMEETEPFTEFRLEIGQ